MIDGAAGKRTVARALTKTDEQLLATQMPFGDHRGRRVIDIPAEDCAWHLAHTARLGLDLHRALMLRVKLKTDESNTTRR